MKIIEPNVELWEQDDKVTHVARCARVCYKKETGNDNVLYENLERSKHWSMFRHETYYSVVNTIDKRSLVNTIDKRSLLFETLVGYQHCPYINYITFRGKIYIVTNGNFIRDIAKDNPVLFNLIYNNQIAVDEAKNIDIVWNHLIRYTFCVDTQISTSRELNRISPNNIAEQSTRYVYEDGTICRPHWLEGIEFDTDAEGNIYPYDSTDEDFTHKVFIYIQSCQDSFDNYKELIDCGLLRQDARGVLPLDTATRCVYTYSIDEWRAIINLRYYGTTGKPHPNAKIAAGMIRKELMELGYDFRE